MSKKKSEFRDIDPFSSHNTYVDVTYINDVWMNPLSPKQYYSLKRMSMYFTIGLFILWAVSVMCMPYG